MRPENILPLIQKLILLGLLGCVYSCAHRAQKWIDKKIIPDTTAYTITTNKQQSKSNIKVLYTGCGGLVIKKGAEAIMTDPYYTGHRWWNFFWIRIDPGNDKKVLAKINAMVPPKNISAVMISHSHYDHLQDLPYLLANRYLNDTLKIIGDSSTHCTINSFMQTGNSFVFADTLAYTQKSTLPPKWVWVSKHMRVLVIASDHAPHYKNIHGMQGNTCKGKPIKLKKPESRSSGNRWLEGKTFSFLVDVMNDSLDRSLLRLYIQSSSCAAPSGFPPLEVLKQKPVDVAFMGVASSTYVDPYPKAILNWLNPEKIVLIHWEDFFRNFYKQKQKSVRLTKIRPLMESLRVLYQRNDISDLADQFSMPKPLTEIKIEY